MSPTVEVHGQQRIEQEQTSEIRLPTELLARVEDRLSHTEFDSPGAYVRFTMEEVLSRVESDDAVAHEGLDESAVKERLESLGYLGE